jgi:hypothetical protein
VWAASGCLLAVMSVMSVGAPAGAATGRAAGNGEAAKDAATIFADATSATAATPSLAMKGTVSNGTNRVTLNVVSAHGSGGGKMFVNGAAFEIVVVPPNLYLRADAATWTKLAGTEAAGQLLAGKWLQTTTADEKFGSFTKLLDTSTMTQSTTTVTKGPVTTFKKHPAIPLHQADGNGTLYVAATGTPYILGIDGSGDSQGQIVFSQFGTAKAPAAPRSSISIDQLQQDTGQTS